MSEVRLSGNLNLMPYEQEAIQKVIDEYVRAVKTFGAFKSAHEGYGVLLEEVDELWDEVKAKQGKRRQKNLEKEATQVAAMGLRFLIDVCLNSNKGFE